MKKKEVPQDKGFMEGRFRDLTYAVDDDGKIIQVLSDGWEPKNEAMRQAMDLVREKTEEVRIRVMNGELSPVAYFMEKNIMDVKILADYAGLKKRRVRRHLKPRYFRQLDLDTLKRYADAFAISVDDLVHFTEKQDQA
jgi:hypothetical protein